MNKRQRKKAAGKRRNSPRRVRRNSMTIRNASTVKIKRLSDGTVAVDVKRNNRRKR